MQPDTIVPDLSNPQAWNRFSYVHNTPTGYSDPTGHVRVADEDLSKNKASMDCRKHSRYCNGGKKKSDEELRAMHPIQKMRQQRDTLDVTKLTDKGYFMSWEGEKNIPSDYWQYLLSSTREDVHWSFSEFLPIEATYYDTPFYNDHGHLTGRGCLDDICYDRSELNYVAQGEIWAAAGVSNKTGHAIVKFWKEAYCFWMCERTDLQEEYDLFDAGYEDYQEHYPPQPVPYDTIPGIFPIPGKGSNT